MYKKTKALSYFARLNIKRILKKNPDLHSISHILGEDFNGNVNHGSFFFYVFPHLYGRLLSNNPEDVISKRSIAFRRKIVPTLRSAGIKLLNGKKMIIEKKIELPDNRPIIFASNHGFLEDAAVMSIMGEGVTYYLFGSLPQAYNTFFGFAAYLTGILLLNRRDKESRKAAIEKAVYALKLGSNIVMCPEGAWNKTINKITIDFWPGVIKIAKKSNALIVPLVQLSEGENIYVSRLEPIDILHYDDDTMDKALDDLRTVINTEVYELMDKYAHVKREDILGDYSDMLDACEAHMKKLTAACGKYYDLVSETTSDFCPREIINAKDVWEPISNLEINPRNCSYVLYARQLVDRLKREDFQHRF